MTWGGTKPRAGWRTLAASDVPSGVFRPCHARSLEGALDPASREARSQTDLAPRALHCGRDHRKREPEGLTGA